MATIYKSSWKLNMFNMFNMYYTFSSILRKLVILKFGICITLLFLQIDTRMPEIRAYDPHNRTTGAMPRQTWIAAMYTIFLW